ncbi:MAG: hypothetical protein L3J28_10740 [Candidatus Polarisedimenticolaceae bacterium]|nr:hypothetical protein [Candidatus Polarisedimenticolaceae bacterium]
MSSLSAKRSVSLWAATAVAVLFGLLTIKSGGTVLFIDGEFREQAGSYVPFVVWFNFIAGFAYLTAGIGLWLRQRWAAWLAPFIALATLTVFALFALHIFNDGSYEQRTVMAMSARSLVWISIALFAYRTVLKAPPAAKIETV